MTYDEAKKLTEGHTSLPQFVAAHILGVSKQQVGRLLSCGSLVPRPLLGAQLVSTSSVLKRVRAKSRRQERGARAGSQKGIAGRRMQKGVQSANLACELV